MSADGGEVFLGLIAEEIIKRRAVVCRGTLAPLGGSVPTVAHGTQEGVLRGVVGVGQLKGRDAVARLAEAEGTQAVGQRFRHLLAELGLIRNKGKRGAGQITAKGPMTAGGRENDLGTELDRRTEHKIGGNIAGVERYDKIVDTINSLVAATEASADDNAAMEFPPIDDGVMEFLPDSDD